MTNSTIDDHGTTEPASDNDPTFDCPNCGATVHRKHRTLRCPSCEYVPNHGSD